MEGVKLLLTTAATGEDTGRMSKRQEVGKGIFVELPPKDASEDGVRRCGKLIKAMYGTKHAVAAWQSEVHTASADIGMETGEHSACAFRRKGVVPQRSSTGTTALSQGAESCSRRGRKRRARAGFF